LNTISKATLYKLDLFGYIRTEVRELTVEFVKYAQYRKAIKVEFIGKGKRKRKDLLETSESTLVILEGWGHPEFENNKPSTQSGQIIYTETRFPPFSQEWKEAFDMFLNEYLTKTSSKVFRDYRNHDPEPDKPIIEPPEDDSAVHLDISTQL
jgi:hypothetical protein